MTDVALLIAEYYPSLYSRRYHQIVSAPDLRSFGSEWAREEAKKAEFDPWMALWIELELLNLANENDQQIYSLLIDYIKAPTISTYYLFQLNKSDLKDWVKRYPLLSYILFDEHNTLMLAVETAHPELHLLLQRIPAYIANNEIPVDKDRRTAFVPSRIDLWRDIANSDENRLLPLPLVWDLISLSQYVEGQHSSEEQRQIDDETTELILGNIYEDELDEALKSSWIYNSRIFDAAINMGATAFDLRLPAAEADNAKLVIEAIESMLQKKDIDGLKDYLSFVLRYVTDSTIFETIFDRIGKLDDQEMRITLGDLIWDFIVYHPLEMRYLSPKTVLAVKLLRQIRSIRLTHNEWKQIETVAKKFVNYKILDAYRSIGVKPMTDYSLDVGSSDDEW